MYRILPNSSWVSINRRVPFKRRVQVYILINNRWFQINAESNFFFFLIKDHVTTDTARFPFAFFPILFLLSVSQYHIDDHHGSGAAKKYKVRLEIQTFCHKIYRGKLGRSSH